MSAFPGAITGEARRHRAVDDWFVVSRVSALWCTQVVTTAERTVDLLHALSQQLDPAVDVHCEDVRRARRWSGTLLPLPDVREVVGRLRLPLASYGGVELSLYTPEDQLSLTPELLLVIYARTDRWTFLLEGMGLVERESAPPPTWIPDREALRAAPALEAALTTAVARLSLTEHAA